jgi:hypothetical protein
MHSVANMWMYDHLTLLLVQSGAPTGLQANRPTIYASYGKRQLPIIYASMHAIYIYHM